MISAEFVQAVRAEAKSGIWSSGVKLARAGAAAVESATGQETVLRVRAPGRAVAYSVVLYPGDDAWECDCDSPVDPCEHVVAATLTMQESTGEPAPSTAARWAHVVYHFSRVDGGLQLQRFLAHPDGQETPLAESVQALVARPSQSMRLQVEQHDLIADRLLEKPLRGPLPASRLDALLTALAPARSVLLDGLPVSISDEPLLPRVTVEDRGENFEVALLRDARVTEIVSPGVALAAEALWRLGETAITGTHLENLPSVRSYTPAQLGELSARVIPDLARRFPVQVKSRRLPPLDRQLRPRLLLELSQLDTGLSVLPTLVYGAPPQVRIDAGRMTYLRGAVPLRDEGAEQRLVSRLREELNLVPGRRVTVQGPEVARLVDKLRRWDGDLTGDAGQVLSPSLKLIPHLHVETDAASHVGFQLQFEVQGGAPGQSVGAEAVLRAWSEGLGLVPLQGGGWAPLPAAWLAKHGQRVVDLLAARAESGTVANHALPQLAELCDALETPTPPELKRLAPLVEGFERLPPAVLPEGITAQPRPYQLQGIAWLQFLRSAGLGGVLADDMGLGKTLQAICALPSGSLVVCPTSVLPNWQAELKRFRPAFKVNAYQGPGRALNAEADVTLTTYALLRLDSAQLNAVEWKAIVLDEAQAIKNPDSQVARAAYQLKGDFRVALSGTPLENRLEELWSVMNFTNRGLLGGRQEFDRRWAQPLAEGRATAGMELRRRIKPFVLRRLKQEVAPELPPRTDAILRVTLDEREQAIYDAVLAASRAEVLAALSPGQSGGVLKALEALLRLRQAACHSGLVPGQHAASSSKLKALREAVETAAAEGHKALVFSQWTSLLDKIEPELKEAEVAFERLDGSTQDRGGVTQRFQSADGPPVMLISLKAGGTGLNLTAADHVFLMDPWWNPAVEAQAADRAHRIGQERPVFVYRLIAQGTVEERILLLQDRKRALFESAFQDAGAAASITREDLLELLA